MKKARMNISHFCFILFYLKIFDEIVTTQKKTHRAHRGAGYFFLKFSDVPPQKTKAISLRSASFPLVFVQHRWVRHQKLQLSTVFGVNKNAGFWCEIP